MTIRLKASLHYHDFPTYRQPAECKVAELDGHSTELQHENSDRIWLAPYTADLNVTHCPVKKFLNFAGILREDCDPPSLTEPRLTRCGEAAGAHVGPNLNSNFALELRTTRALEQSNSRSRPLPWATSRQVGWGRHLPPTNQRKLVASHE